MQISKTQNLRIAYFEIFTEDKFFIFSCSNYFFKSASSARRDDCSDITFITLEQQKY